MDWGARAGAVLIMLLVMCGVFAPWLSPRDPYEQLSTGLTAQGQPLPPGTNGYLLGTDPVGRDVASRLIFGARTTLIIGFCANLLTLVVGVALGGGAGYMGGWTGTLVMRGVDIFMAFPAVLLAIALAAVLQPSLPILIIVLGLVSWTALARVVYGETLSLRESDYVLAARAVGARGLRIMGQHIAPHWTSLCVVYGALGLATTIRAEAALSYLGVGVPPPTPTWGGMIQQGQSYYRVAPWLLLYPGLAIIVAVLGFTLLGNALRDALDPRRRRHR